MLLELSYTMSETIPKWPTNPDEAYTHELSVQKGDACNASTVSHHMHNGTHVDAPRHFDPSGKTIDQVPIENFFYTAPYVWDLPKQRGQCITLADIKAKEQNIAQCDILFIYTGYSKLRDTDPDGYVNEFPSIAPDAAAYLRSHFPKLKAIALDVISVDDAVTAGQTGFPTHHNLLETNASHPERSLLLYEDVNISPLLGVKAKAICAFPIRWAGLEAAPVAMVALV